MLWQSQSAGLQNEYPALMGRVSREEMLREHTGERSTADDDDIERPCVRPDGVSVL